MSKKTDSYSALSAFNQACDGAVDAVRGLADLLSEMSQKIAISSFEENRSAVNVHALEVLHHEEQKDLLHHAISKREAITAPVETKQEQVRVNGKS